MAFVVCARRALSVAGALARGAPQVRGPLAGAIARLARAGCATPRLDAELLLAHALGISREQLLVADLSPLDAVTRRAFEDALQRRAGAREPVAYITGRRAFRRLELCTDRRALIPRPESELLVECALCLPHGASVLDVGTGCGAIALALKDERPDLRVSASDVSAEALSLAGENSRRLGLEVEWRKTDLLAGLADDYDAILANLPYVADAQRATLAAEILDHEPPLALFAGHDGLAAIAALLAALRRHPRVRFVALEVGAGQAAAVRAMTRCAGFETVRGERDLAGIERVVIGEAPPR
jgi:release factor glutamine methyltransferase